MANKRLTKSLKKTLNKKENKLITFAGELGIPLNGSKLVEVPNRKGYVFVRISGNMSEVIQAYNSEVSAIYGLPVLLARQNNVYRIIGRNLTLYRDWNNIPYLPRHGSQHSFNHELGMGADITWVYSQQFMPLLGYPSGSQGSMNLSIVPAFYSWQGQYYYAQTTGTPSFTPYLPTITGSAVMTLLYIQPSDNSLRIIAGSPFSNTITGSAQLAQYIPDIDRSVGIPIAAVRLVTGTTGLLWNNIYDVRDFFTIGDTGGGGMGFVAWDEGVLLGTGTVLNFVGPNVDASISGSVVRVFISGSSGGNTTIPATGTFVVQDEGSTLGSATTLNAVGPILDISISGSVARLNAFIATGSIGRSQLNVDTTGQAVARKIIAGVGIGLSSTGVDSGTGDVSVMVTGTFFTEEQIEAMIDAEVSISAIPIDGWIQDSDWVRTENHSFVKNGNATAIFRKGIKIKCVDGSGSTKQGVVGSSGFTSGSVTTVNLIPNTDFILSGTIANFPSWSPIENPTGFPHGFNWNANPQGFSAVPAGATYKWFTNGNLITLMYVEGSDGTSNLTTFTASAPIVAISASTIPLGTTVDAGVVQVTPGRVVIQAGASLMTFRKDTANSAWTGSLGKRAVVILIYEF